MASKRTTPSFVREVPDGELLPRLVCTQCGFIRYENPKVVVGSVCSWEDKILICRRAIDPRRGFWTVPAGYMELHETSAEGARREAWEEACARIEIDGLLAVYDIPRIGQLQLMYRARLVSPDVAAGPESTAVRLVPWEEIPWDDLAFPSVRWALQHHRQVLGRSTFTVFGNPPGETGDY